MDTTPSQRAFRRPLLALPRPLIRVLTRESLDKIKAQRSGTQETPTASALCAPSQQGDER